MVLMWKHKVGWDVRMRFFSADTWLLQWTCSTAATERYSTECLPHAVYALDPPTPTDARHLSSCHNNDFVISNDGHREGENKFDSRPVKRKHNTPIRLRDEYIIQHNDALVNFWQQPVASCSSMHSLRGHSNEPKWTERLYIAYSTVND